jgi:hypothetical protein
MKNLLYISILLLAACFPGPSSDQPATTEKPKASLDLFTGITPDSFYVYSTENPSDKNFRFHGKVLDSSVIAAFPYYVRTDPRWSHEYFACDRFALDSARIALITRTPGEYDSSVIKMYVYDTGKDSVTAELELADIWGDAGEFTSHSSCIFYNPDKHINVLTYYKSLYDHSVNEVENDTIIEYSDEHVLLDLSKTGNDTVSIDSAEIMKKYPAAMKKLMGFN